MVGGAVTAGAFGLAHGDEIEAVGLHQALVDAHLDELVFGHVHHAAALFHLFPGRAHGAVHLEPQNFIEIAVGVGVHRQHRFLAVFQQVAQQHAGHGGLAGAAFAGHGDEKTHD